MKLHLLVLFMCVFCPAQGWQGVATTEHYNNSLILDNAGNYQVYWNYNTTHVTFEVRVKTWGYIGFGLSPNGKMFPADVVLGWVKDGNVYFTDRHTTDHTPPTVDKSQDWFLLHGEENDFGTVLKFVRKINTCDPDDLDINNATQRLIYSYHPDDPANENSLMYHGGERRGTKSVALLNVNKKPEIVDFEEIYTYDFTAGNYLLPDRDTVYFCIAHQIPDLGRKHHMIEFEPIFTPGNEHLVHHLVIQRCPGKYPHLHGAKGECFPEYPKGWPICPEMFIGWATGGGPYYFPPNTGYPVSGPDDFSFMVMQIHYDNPSHRSGVLDNSGIRMRLTPTLRQHDVGSLVASHTVLPYQVIPPNEDAFVSKGYCAEQCLSSAMDLKNTNEIRVIAVLQHAHLLATRIKTRHFRNGTELPPIYDDPHYDFYFQEYRTLKEELIVKRGDSIKVECTYTTTHNSEPAFGGLTTRDEMCEAFFYYYPKMDVLSCSSFPNLNKMYNHIFNISFEGGPGSFQEFMKSHYDWSNSTERETFKRQLDNATYLHICISNTHNATSPFGHQYWEFQEHEFDHMTYASPPSPCDSGN